MTTKTIGAGTTVAAGYTITSAGLSLSNYGFIGSTAGAAHVGVYIQADAYVINQNDATIISNGVAGIKAKVGVTATVYNYGLISGGTYGVNLRGGGTVANQAGTITASSGPGVYLSQSGIVFNHADIYAAGTGVDLKAGGNAFNTGAITVSKEAAVYLGGAGSVVNAGFIEGATSGIRMLLGGYVHNYSGAQIVGHGPNGVLFNAGATLLDGGYIHGVGGTAVGFAAGFNNYLTIQPGASFSGVVNGGNTLGAANVSSMMLASEATTGTLSGLGTEYLNFATIAVAPKAAWVLSGGNSISYVSPIVTFYDDGTLTNTGAFNGFLSVNSGGVFTNASGAAITGAIADYGKATNVGGITSGVVGVLINTTLPFTNQSGGTIHAGDIGVGVSGADAFVNGGSVYGQSYGVTFTSVGGSVTNQSNSTITGDSAIAGALTVVNAGYLDGQVTFQNTAASKLVVDPGATFNGNVVGGYSGASTSTLVMASGAAIGTISGIGSQFSKFNQMTVNANASWMLTGTNSIALGYSLTSSGTVTDRGSLTNAGLITSNSIGIVGGTGATIVNKPFGVIRGASEGISFKAAGTLFNFYDIDGSGPSGTAVSFPSGFTNLLVLYPNATFSGIVNGGNAIGDGFTSTLELGGPGYGRVSGIGSQYVNFAQVTIEPAGKWLLNGTDVIPAGATLSDGGALYNSGAVTGNITVDTSASFTNNSIGSVIGTVYGLAGTPSPSVVNRGKITGGTYGVNLRGGGFVSNQSNAILTATALAIYAAANSTVVNQGGINAGIGIKLHAGGAVTNQSGGSVTGVSGGAILLAGAGTVVNAGSIQGGLAANPEVGVSLTAGGMVTNQSGASINAFGSGVLLGGSGGTVINAGAIIGGSGTAVAFPSGPTNRLVLEPGSALTGTANGGNVVGGTSVSTLELTSGASLGTVSGIGTNYLNFAQVVVDGNGSWLMKGTNTIVAGATFSNGGSLTITGAMTDSGLLTNSLLFSGALTLGAGGVVTNQSGATITSTAAGVTDAAIGTVVNGGKITASTAGVYLKSGSVTNQSGGAITGGTYGVAVYSGSIVNAGSIQGGSSVGQPGVLLKHGGSLTNQSGGTISAAISGVHALAGSPATVINAGDIAGDYTFGSGGTGVVLYGGGSVTNQSSGTIVGAIGVSIGGGGTVVNNGTIEGGVTFASGFTNRLVIDDGSAGGNLQSGGANGGNAVGDGFVSTLEMTSSGSRGILAGVGSTYRNFEQFVIDPGASWQLDDNALAAGTTLTDQGTMDVEPGATVTDDGGATIAGTSGIVANATVSDADWVGLSGLVVGGAGSGALLVNQSGSLGVSGGAAGGIDIGQSAGGKGILTVTDSDTRMTNSGSFIVGDGGLGSLSIEGAASVTTAPGTGAGMIIANTTSASGSTVNINGAGSDLAVTGTVVVGEGGSGDLLLDSGATMTAGALVVGAAATGDGDVSLSGTGTTLDVTGALTLGSLAAGELSLLGGAQMTIGGGVVGSSKTAPGNLDVEGAGSLLTINGGTLVVGANGPAEFTLGIGATLSGEVANGQFGVVSEYGNVDPATDPNDGTQNVGFGNSLIYDYYVANSGTIKITSGTATFYTPLVTDETNAADGSTSGLWVIGARETLVMNTTSVDATQVFDFTSASAATLVIGQIPQASPTATDTFNGQTMPALTGSIAPGAANVLPGWDAPIENFQSGDLIVLRGLTYGSATASGDVVTVWSGPGGQGSALGSLTFLTKSGTPSTAQAALAATEINDALACFAAGTRIATPDGWVSVENLRVGDRVRTIFPVTAEYAVGREGVQRDQRLPLAAQRADGRESDQRDRRLPVMAGPDPAIARRAMAEQTETGASNQPDAGAGRPSGAVRADRDGRVRAAHDRIWSASHDESVVWIGSRTVDCASHPRPETVWPVRVAAGAFGSNTPSRDLYLSPDHAVFVNGVLIPVKLLINGTSIASVRRRSVIWYHVELPEHAVILAEGLPVESYLDTGDRANFGDNGTIRLFPDFAARLSPDAAMRWETRGAAPLVLAGPKLDGAKRTLRPTRIRASRPG